MKKAASRRLAPWSSNGSTTASRVVMPFALECRERIEPVQGTGANRIRFAIEPAPCPPTIHPSRAAGGHAGRGGVLRGNGRAKTDGPALAGGDHPRERQRQLAHRTQRDELALAVPL